MNHAKLKRLVNKNHLTTNGVAAYLNVDLSTVESWLGGVKGIPPLFAKELKNLNARFDQIVQNVLQLAIAKPAAEIKLLYYLRDDDFADYAPNDWKVLKSSLIHSSLMHRVVAFLGKTGIFARLIPFNREQYQVWLEAEGKVNSQQTRAEWSGMQQ